jgi:hypothetical protein
MFRARGIFRAWKNVPLPVLETETYLENARTRLDKIEKLRRTP